ncbi:MAG: hypothetical protein HYR97_00915 [Candidatus Melainabacteria bacterium]|nr:hypothetical protein [Candidatus Melainabacteria bacterium]
MSKKTILRITIWLSVVLISSTALLLNFLGDMNKYKTLIEKNLKNQLRCTVKLGELDWDLEGLNIGVSTNEMTLLDSDDNLVLQTGPARFVWNIFNILRGHYTHFYRLEAANFYVNLIRYENNKWNLIEIFPPGPAPEVDNLKINNGIIYFIDEFSPVKKSILYKDTNLYFEKAAFSTARNIKLTSRVGSLTSQSFLEIKGNYTESKKFKWRRNEINLLVRADNLQLANWETYITQHPQINSVDGDFTGAILIQKKAGIPQINIKTKTKTNNLKVVFKNKDATQPIYIPKTGFTLKAAVKKDKIKILNFNSKIDELSYSLTGEVINWSNVLPEVNLKLKTNKFNFKNIKPYLPLSLLPATTRERIEPINDDGFVKLDLDIKGLAIQPKYYGTILLSKFNLTPESGFLNFIQGLEGKLTLDNEILKIDYLNIPLLSSQLVLKGEVDSNASITKFNIAGNDLNLRILQDLLVQLEPNVQILNEIDTYGKLDVNLNVVSTNTASPEIKGNIKFYDAGIHVFKDEPIEISNAYGELELDGAKVNFKQVSGFINEEGFYIDGGFSLKEDEDVNLQVKADRLKIIPYVISFFISQSPVKLNTQAISGEINNVDLNFQGKISNPEIYGGLEIKNVSFNIPELEKGINNISGKLRFEKDELVIEGFNGLIQDTEFSIAGYIDDIFHKAAPRFRLVTGGLDVGNLWRFSKPKLQHTPFKTEIEKLENVAGYAALDLFLQPKLITGNIYFDQAAINYKPLPFSLNNLQGRLVLGESNLSIFGLMGAIDQSNEFSGNITVNNHYSKNPIAQGQIDLNFDPTPLINVINPSIAENFQTEGIIPSTVNFSFQYPYASIGFYSTLPEMLILEYKPFFSKPTNLAYTLSGKIGADLDKKDLYLNHLQINTEELSLKTIGTVMGFDLPSPEFMIDFETTDLTRTYMLLKPITPLKSLRVFGDIDLKGSFSGTLTDYAISSKAKLTNVKIQPPVKEDTRIFFEEGDIDFYLDTSKGYLISDLKDITYLSFHGKELKFNADYSKPTVYVKELTLDGDPGYIKASGDYNFESGKFDIDAKGEDLELSKLGSFVLLDPSKLAGMTSFSLVLGTSGKTEKEAIANSNGEASFSITDGHIGEIALLHKGLQLANVFGQGILGFNVRNVFSLFFKYQDGDFNTIDGKLKIKNGVIKAKEFHYRANNLFLNSYGNINLPKSSIELRFYGYLPEIKEEPSVSTTPSDQTVTSKIKKVSGALTILPETLSRHRIVIPFISTTPPQHFKFELKGNMKNQKKLLRRTRRSFKWLRGRRLEKELEYVPKPIISP